MADLPSPDALASIAEGVLRRTLDPAGTGAANLAPGSRNSVLVSVLAALFARMGRYTASRVQAGRIATATGTDLDQLAQDLYGEPRKVATAATGIVPLRRTGSTATLIPKGTRFALPATSTTAAIVYAADVDVSTASVDVDVPVTCIEVGPRGNLTGTTAPTAILDPLPVAWSIATLTIAGTPPVFGGGDDAESDDTFRARLEQVATDVIRQRGTRAAVLFGALRVPGIAYVNVLEPADGSVLVFCGDTNFALSSMRKAAVENELVNWRAFGVPAHVKAYATTDVPIVGTVHMSRPLSAYDTDAIAAACTANILAYFANRTNADEVIVTAIEAAIFAAHPEVQQVTLSAPTVDILRQSDAHYALTATLPRYVTRAELVALTIALPAVAS